MGTNLTERQQRERQFYNQHAKATATDHVVFDPVLGHERRPWNPYWFVYQCAMDHFSGPAARLLDFGCGAGDAAMRYARIGYQVDGFDICEEYVRQSAAKAARFGFEDRTAFSVQTAEQLSYPDETFDVVAGIDILHHVDIERAIQEVARVLKPGGIGIFREFMEVPVFDSVRNTSLMLRLFHKGGCGHHTEDERKLTRQDIRTIRQRFADCELHRFCLFSRIYRVTTRRHPDRPCRVEILDWRLFRCLPLLRPLGGEVVIVVRK